MTNACKRCRHPHDPSRMFCPGCGLKQPGRLGMRISTEDSRGRALDELDRRCGLHDSDHVAERREAEFISA